MTTHITLTPVAGYDLKTKAFPYIGDGMRRATVSFGKQFSSMHLKF